MNVLWKSSLILAAVLVSVVNCKVVTTTKSRNNATDLRLIVLGDWGGLPINPYTTGVEVAVAAGMGKYADTFNPEMVLALGDNYYFTGVKNVDDARFKETYEEVFTAPSLNIPWYVIAGNHDHYGNASAEIAYSEKSSRWNFPNYYYTINATHQDLSVRFIMLDTILLCGNTDPDLSDAQPEGPEDVGVAEDQWAFLESQLQLGGDYVIVGGHFPVWSVAEHGPTQCLVDRLMPLLHKYNVSAYICGHDHNLQHLTYTTYDTTVEYFVVGAANFVDDSTAHMNNVPPKSLKFHYADKSSLGGYATMQIDSENIVFTFLSAGGHKLYQTNIPRRSK